MKGVRKPKKLIREQKKYFKGDPTINAFKIMKIEYYVTEKIKKIYLI